MSLTLPAMMQRAPAAAAIHSGSHHPTIDIVSSGDRGGYPSNLLSCSVGLSDTETQARIDPGTADDEAPADTGFGLWLVDSVRLSTFFEDLPRSIRAAYRGPAWRTSAALLRIHARPPPAQAGGLSRARDTAADL
ncbi:MAG: hypothetical protein KDJ77_20405 [Rhodobiaceae bacterium]|nr:hypothetical protein [Rhodobiaceae bacterium]